MAADAQNRQLPASPRKIAKARSDGQVARSRDLAHLAAIGAGGALLIGLAPRYLDGLRGVIETGLRFDVQALAEEGVMSAQLSGMATQLLALVLPLGLAVMAAAMLAGLAAGGWNFTLKPLEPNFGKIHPLSGIGRLFSGHQLGETLKACLLAAVLLAVGSLYLRQQLPGFTELVRMPLPTALVEAASLLKGGLVLLVLVLAAFALVDVPLQRHLLMQRLRMSHDEVKKEMKDVEGNVEVKAKIRARMRQMAARRMLAAVPSADLVVMNPTHYAVALKYDEASMSAPRVVAKGADLLAMKIRDLATEHRVPVLQAPPLARALYAHTEVDQEIPAALFAAVAQVLAWVYQLRQRVATGGADLPPPAVQVPAELDPAQAPGRGAARRRPGAGA